MTMLDKASSDSLPLGALIGMPTASAIQKPDTLSIRAYTHALHISARSVSARNTQCCEK